MEHQRNQSWWKEIASSTFEHFPNKELAKEAEKLAIKNEHPVYNIVHNKNKAHYRRRTPEANALKSSSSTGFLPNKNEEILHWYSKDDDLERYSGLLWLEPELNGISSIRELLDSVGSWDSFELIDFYVAWLKENNSLDDRLPIHWRVGGAENRYFIAPWQERDKDESGDYQFSSTFLDYFCNPFYEDETELNWFSLPVITENYEKFWEALNWRPSALQATCRFKTLVKQYGYE